MKKKLAELQMIEIRRKKFRRYREILARDAEV
jgi:hypothetical protein